MDQDDFKSNDDLVNNFQISADDILAAFDEENDGVDQKEEHVIESSKFDSQTLNNQSNYQSNDTSKSSQSKQQEQFKTITPTLTSKSTKTKLPPKNRKRKRSSEIDETNDSSTKELSTKDVTVESKRSSVSKPHLLSETEQRQLALKNTQLSSARISDLCKYVSALRKFRSTEIIQQLQQLGKNFVVQLTVEALKIKSENDPNDRSAIKPFELREAFERLTDLNNSSAPLKTPEQIAFKRRLRR